MNKYLVTETYELLGEEFESSKVIYAKDKVALYNQVLEGLTFPARVYYTAEIYKSYNSSQEVLDQLEIFSLVEDTTLLERYLPQPRGILAYER